MMDFRSDCDFFEASMYNQHGVQRNGEFHIDDWRNQAPGQAFGYWDDCETQQLPYACTLSDSIAQLSCEAGEAPQPYTANFPLTQQGFHMAFPAKHEEQRRVVGTSAWVEVVKHSARESESTSDGPISDNTDSHEEELEVYSPLKSECLVQDLIRATSDDLTPPVKHTFIHFNSTVSLTRCNSAPGVLTRAPFSRKYNPEMQERHNRGDCRPCAYFVHKEDGCRWGTECQFCHLCPAEAVKRRKKEKVKALKAEAAAQQLQRNKHHRNAGWKWSGEWRQNRRYWGK